MSVFTPTAEKSTLFISNTIYGDPGFNVTLETNVDPFISTCVPFEPGQTFVPPATLKVPIATVQRNLFDEKCEAAGLVVTAVVNFGADTLKLQIAVGVGPGGIDSTLTATYFLNDVQQTPWLSDTYGPVPYSGGGGPIDLEITFPYNGNLRDDVVFTFSTDPHWQQG